MSRDIPEFVGDISTSIASTNRLVASERVPPGDLGQLMTAYRLHLLGWTQREIGDVVGMDHTSIGNFWGKFSELKKITKNLSAGGQLGRLVCSGDAVGIVSAGRAGGKLSE